MMGTLVVKRLKQKFVALQPWFNYTTKISFQVERQEKYNPSIDRNWLKLATRPFKLLSLPDQKYIFLECTFKLLHGTGLYL